MVSERYDSARIGAGVSLAVLFLAVAWLIWGEEGVRGGGRIGVHCAAGLKPPVEELAREYERRFGVTVELTYGGSGTLLSALTVGAAGDLYLAGDDSFVDTAVERGLVREVLPVAEMRPVIGVAAGNPKRLAGLDDLLREDLRVGVANPEAAAVGRITRAVLEETGTWTRLEPRLLVTKPTVTELANDLLIGALDAAVIWDATANQVEGVDLVRVPELDAAVRTVALGVLAEAPNPREALGFARFLAARDVGAPVFERHGYVPVPGDPWEREPELLLMSGAMLNAAIDATISAFEEREGVRVTRVYNGCGILVAQMKAGATPDAYFSCDRSFLDAVADRFDAGRVVSANPLVILVAGGNPREIEMLADLAREGLRVGLAHPEKSALGALTRRLLEADGTWEQLAAAGNVQVESATGDFLVNQLRTGSLDAVVVYASNAAAAREHLDVIPIRAEGALAIQPYAVARDTDHKQLMVRLLEALQAAASRERFEALGFEWRADAAR